VVNDLGGPRDGSGADVSMAQKVVNAILAEGGRAVANGADISTMAGGQSLFDDAIKHFGRADILVNNAGILLDQTFAKATEAAWDKVLKVHLKGTFCCTQPVFRWMRENGGGVIVNTASTSGLIGNFGQSNYGAAKAGMIGLMNVLHLEGVKNNIRVNTLLPTAATGMTAGLIPAEMAALMSPETVTPAVLFLVSEDAPSKVILGAGAGAFAVTHITETAGLFLGRAERTPETIAARFAEIADPATARPLDNAFAQTFKFVEAAAKALGVKLPQPGASS
jgi:NAD(P)-dependent dehydrogenase (short-subunit alcohol dehydrogenase family)